MGKPLLLACLVVALTSLSFGQTTKPTTQPVEPEKPKADISRKLKADAPDDVKAYFERCKEAKFEAIKRAEDYLASAIKNHEMRKKDPEVAKGTAARIERAKAGLAAVKNPAHIELARITAKLGSIGYVSYPEATGKPEVTVVKVLDASSAIVTIEIPRVGQSVRWPPTILKGIDTSNEKFRDLEPTPGTRMLWHAATDRAVEGYSFRLLVLEPFDLEKFLEPVK